MNFFKNIKNIYQVGELLEAIKKDLKKMKDNEFKIALNNRYLELKKESDESKNDEDLISRLKQLKQDIKNHL